SILTIAGSALIGAGVRAGDLLVASEGTADTIAVRCRPSCTVRRIADGPAVAHAEGHIVFARLGGASAARAAAREPGSSSGRWSLLRVNPRMQPTRSRFGGPRIAPADEELGTPGRSAAPMRLSPDCAGRVGRHSAGPSGGSLIAA